MERRFLHGVALVATIVSLVGGALTGQDEPQIRQRARAVRGGRAQRERAELRDQGLTRVLRAHPQAASKRHLADQNHHSVFVPVAPTQFSVPTHLAERVRSAPDRRPVTVFGGAHRARGPPTAA